MPIEPLFPPEPKAPTKTHSVLRSRRIADELTLDDIDKYVPVGIPRNKVSIVLGGDPYNSYIKILWTEDEVDPEYDHKVKLYEADYIRWRQVVRQRYLEYKKANRAAERAIAEKYDIKNNDDLDPDVTSCGCGDSFCGDCAGKRRSGS